MACRCVRACDLARRSRAASSGSVPRAAPRRWRWSNWLRVVSRPHNTAARCQLLGLCSSNSTVDAWFTECYPIASSSCCAGPRTPEAMSTARLVYSAVILVSEDRRALATPRLRASRRRNVPFDSGALHRRRFSCTNARAYVAAQTISMDIGFGQLAADPQKPRTHRQLMTDY